MFVFVPSQETHIKRNHHLVLVLEHTGNLPEHFEVLFKNAQLDTHEFLASYSKTPAEMLHDIALLYKSKVHFHDKCYEPGSCKGWREVAVSKYIAENPNVTAKTLRLLVGHLDDQVRKSVAQNMTTQTEMLGLLVADSCSLVRSEVAKHPQTSLTALRKMLDGEKEFHVLRDLVENPKSTSRMISTACRKLMAMDRKERHRLYLFGLPKAIMKNPKTPKGIKKMIEKDGLPLND